AWVWRGEGAPLVGAAAEGEDGQAHAGQPQVAEAEQLARAVAPGHEIVRRREERRVDRADCQRLDQAAEVAPAHAAPGGIRLGIQAELEERLADERLVAVAAREYAEPLAAQVLDALDVGAHHHAVGG